LTVNGTAPSGLTNTDGLLLDGAYTGQPGSNFVTAINSGSLAGAADQRPVADIVRSRAKPFAVRVKLLGRTHAK
jgi:hypothetical protein